MKRASSMLTLTLGHIPSAHVKQRGCAEFPRERPVVLRVFAGLSLLSPAVFKETRFLWFLFVSVSDACVDVNLEVCKFGSVCLPKRFNVCTSVWISLCAPKGVFCLSLCA